MQIESIADLAKGHIQVWIIKGEYEPGQQLKEEEIAARLDISRPPVREAFKMLEAEGLVVRRPRRGVFVTQMTRKDVWEAYTLKAALYELSIGLAMDRISKVQLTELESIVAQMEDSVAGEPVDLMRYQEHHQRFHDQIMRISGHDRLKKISASIHNQVSRFSYLSLQNREHLYASVRYHREIVMAVKSGEKALACELTKAHVLEALDVLLLLSELQMDAAEEESIAT
ncbi:MAG: GntR family transcriptional regulator [Desulfobacterales bacterium]|jgi:DNA-binding GntR family transcriptional regulator